MSAPSSSTSPVTDPSTSLANRAATYLSLKRYVPACHDAIESAKADPDNWKAHWRQGVALMAMARKKFRTTQAIEAFERCAKCTSLPENKRSEVSHELAKARQRFADQEEEVFYLAFTALQL